MLMMMATLLRTSYEMSHPVTKNASILEFNPETKRITQEKTWADKAVQKYAASQEKKWRHWNEAMFEPAK
jgi:hypothetical protein